jgi:hypothetical protein
VSHHAHERKLRDGRVREPGHTRWDCKYHVIFIPKCRRRMIYVELRPPLARRDQGGMSRDQKPLWRVMFTFLWGGYVVLLSQRSSALAAGQVKRQVTPEAA